MNRKGFSLVELLGVIVLLAVIALITVPILTGVIDDSKQSAFKSSLNGIKKAIETDYSDNNFDTSIKYYYGGFQNGAGNAYNSDKKLVAYTASGTNMREIEVSGEIVGKGQGSVSASGVVSVGIYTDKYCGIVKGNDVKIYVIGTDISQDDCINKVKGI